MDKKWKEEENIKPLDLKAFLFIDNRTQCNYGRKKLIRVLLVTSPLLCDIVRTGIPGVFLLCGFGGGLNSPSLPLVFFGKKKSCVPALSFFFFFFFLAHVTHGVCSDDGCLCVREILFTFFKPLWFSGLEKPVVQTGGFSIVWIFGKNGSWNSSLTHSWFLTHSASGKKHSVLYWISWRDFLIKISKI